MGIKLHENMKRFSFLGMITALFMFSAINVTGQTIPTTGEVECFVMGDGGVFLDNGADVNYPNCGCFTTTTLCSPDGGPITVTFEEFGVNATFDYLQLTEGMGSGTVLYDNGAGGGNAGDTDLDDMIASNGSASFTSNTGCITFNFFASTVVNLSGWVVNVTANAGNPGDNLPCGTTLDCLPLGGINIDDVTAFTADISWALPDSMGTYQLEYGPPGFMLGTGTLIPTSDTFVNLTGLMEDTDYEFYIQMFCSSGDTSSWAGPFSFTTADLCPTFSGVSIDNVAALFADISWIPSDTSGTYVIEIDTAGFTPGTGMIFTTSDSSITLDNLEEGTEYEFYIQLDCANGDSTQVQGSFTFTTFRLNDVGIVDIDTCDLSAGTVTVTLMNFGANPQSLIPYKFSINNVAAGVPIPLDGFFTGVISKDSIITLTFNTMTSFDVPGTYVVKAWTCLDKDNNAVNDTFTILYNTPPALPVYADFEDLQLPAGWSTPFDFGLIVYPPNSHNNPTAVVADNIWAGDQMFTIQTRQYGPLAGGDELTYDYRYAQWSAGTIAATLGTGDSLRTQISTDCGLTYETIDIVHAGNHTPSVNLQTRFVDLSAYEGKSIVIRLNATWGTGDNWLDLDNINLLGCPVSFGITGSVTDESGPGEGDGTIALDVAAGVPPFTYDWNNGMMTDSISNLTSGNYTVVVVDSNGCADTASFNLTFIVTNEFLADQDITFDVFPNPTSGLLNTHVTLPEKAATVNLSLTNALGQELYVQEYQNITEIKEQLSLENRQDGVYFLSVQVDEKQPVVKRITKLK